MKLKQLFKTALALLTFSLSVSAVARQVNSYEVSLDTSLRTVVVKANLETHGEYLTMDWEAADFLPDGWSHFVREIHAFTPDYTPISLDYEQPGRWKMEHVPAQILLEYVISITHDSIIWEEGGHDESAYVLEDLLFMVGRVFLITAGQRSDYGEMTEYKVAFQDLPEDYQVSTTWMPAGNGDRIWKVKGTRALLSSMVLIGIQHREQVQDEGVEVVLAGAPAYKPGLQSFARIFESLVPQARKSLGELNNSKFTLMANVAPATRDPYFSGGVLSNGISIISPVVPDESILPLVQHILYHEYLHLYSEALNFEPTEVARNYWFFEGVHDYLSGLLLYESGMVDRTAFMTAETGLLGNWKIYSQVDNHVNIMEAGEAKFDNYDLIYYGGHLLGFLMDLTFLKASDGAYDLVDFWSELVSKQLTPGRAEPLTYQMLRDLAVERGGKGMLELFDTHIEGDALIRINQALGNLGFELVVEGTEWSIKDLTDNKSPAKAVLRASYFDRATIQSGKAILNEGM